MPAGRVLDSEVPRELAQAKAFVQGPDRRGRALGVLIGANHVPRADHSECARFIHYCIDCLIASADPSLNPDGWVVGILDMRGFGWRNLDVMGGISLALAAQRHYVERVEALYLFGTSPAFRRCYALVEPFIDPVTKRKIRMLPADLEEAQRLLAADVGAEHLPPLLGGTAELRPADQAWALVEERRRLDGRHRPQAAGPPQLQQEEQQCPPLRDAAAGPAAGGEEPAAQAAAIAAAVAAGKAAAAQAAEAGEDEGAGEGEEFFEAVEGEEAAAPAPPKPS